jgi:hypothetical protein
MKASKWLKWKIGAVCTLGIAIIFQVVRADPQFAVNKAAAAPDQPGTIQSDQQDDQVMEDLFNSGTESDSGGAAGFAHHRGGRFHGQGSNGSTGPSYDTQTGRS